MKPLEEKAPRTKRPVQVALFRTVLEVLTSHGSSVIWCLSCIPVRGFVAEGRAAMSYPLLQNRACQFPGTRLLNHRVLVLHTISRGQNALTPGSVALFWQLQHQL